MTYVYLISIYNAPGKPGISNCVTPKQKASEFLDFHLKPLMQCGWSYIRDSGNFIHKMKRLERVPEDSFLITTDVVGLYPSIPHKEGILALKANQWNKPPQRFLQVIWLS